MATTAIDFVTFEELRFLVRELKAWKHPQAETLLEKALSSWRELASFDGRIKEMEDFLDKENAKRG